MVGVMIKEFDSLTDSETELMLKAPVLVCILIAGADGTIDKKEIKEAIAQTQKKTKAALSDYLKEVSQDFEDKIRRAANLHLEPDLNDGVVLNIAPLHELVPWKESKKYWEELLEGKYEWSSIGKQLRQKGLVK